MSRYQKGKTNKVKTNLDLLEIEIVSGSGICWAICKSAPHPGQPRQHPTTQWWDVGVVVRDGMQTPTAKRNYYKTNYIKHVENVRPKLP